MSHFSIRSGACALPCLLLRARARGGTFFVAALLVIVMALSASSARATTYSVNSLGDTIATDGVITLREAIAAADSGFPRGDAPAGGASDTINFAVTGTIRLNSALPPISTAMTINGPAAPGIIISGDANGSGTPNAGDVPVFRIEGNGNLALSNVTVSGAFNDNLGSALTNFGTVTLTNATFSGNSSSDSGIISNDGTLTITNGTFTGNTGAISNRGPLTISNSRFSNNTSGGLGGAINSSVRSDSIAPFTLNISDSTFNGNTSGTDGGALYVNGPLQVARCAFTGNSATGAARPADEASFGGAISLAYTNNSQGGTLSISDSTISGNSAPKGGGGGLTIDTNDGGTVAGTVALTNCTISGNSALAGGGGIVNFSGTLRLQNVTVTGNRANDQNIGAIASLNDDGVRTEIGNSIVSGNIGNDVSSDFVEDGTASTLVSLGYNLIGNGTTAGFNQPGDQRGVTNPGLGALANNGGPTQTHLPNAGSPAIDQGNTTLTVDQRGVARPIGAADDIGAVEVGGTVAESGLVVTTLADTVANDGLISLREAVTTANTDGVASAITFAVNGTITLAQGELTLTSDNAISISGPAAGIVISGNKAGRIFVVNQSADATLNGLTLRDGLALNGGAIDNSGTLTITRSTFIGNVSGTAMGSASDDEGGAIYSIGSALTISDSTFTNNSAGEGGAIKNLRTLTLTNSTLTGNSAITGAAISNGSSSNSATATIMGSTLANNTARSFGGAVFNAASSSCTITNSKLTGNAATNSAGSGGAIYNNVQGRVTVTGSSLTGNSAGSGGGAIFNVSALTITGSTLAGNSATMVGGAIYTATSSVIMGQPDPVGQTLISNSTLSGNSAGSSNGGAIYNASGLTRIESSTIAGNSALANRGAGVASQSNGSTQTRVANSIIADNRTAGGGADSGTDADFVNGGTNTFISQGNNLIGDGNGAANFAATERGVTAAQLRLGALADNGGPTQTRLPGAGSVAIDKGATDLTVDQRGVARPAGAADDIGAVETPAATNRAPSVANVNLSTTINTARSFAAAQFDAAFTDPDEGDALQNIQIVTLPTNGSLRVRNAAATANLVIGRDEIQNLVYTPNAGFTGADSFQYNASDGVAFAANNASVNIAVNAAPATLNFGVSLTPKAPLTNETVTATPVIASAVGVTFAYVWSVNGVVRPGETTNKLDLSKAGNGDKGQRVSVVVTATRGTVTGTATNFVNVINSAPTANNATASGAAGALISVPVSGADADGDSLTFKRVGGPEDGTGSFVTTNGVTSFNYRSRAFFNGTETVRFVALDNTGKPSNIATISIGVSAQARAIGLGVSLLPFGPRSDTVLTAQPLIGDGAGVTYAYVWSVNGKVRPGETAQTIDLGKPGNGNRGDTISVVVTARRGIDSGTATNSATIVGSAPVANDAMGSGLAEAQIVIPVSGSDADGDPITFKRVGGPENGTGSFVTTNGRTSFVYRSRARFNGTEIIRFVAIQADGRTSIPATITINVTSSTPDIGFGVKLTPNGPTTNQTLTASIVLNDRGGVSFSYAWSVNGVVRPGETSNTLDLSKPGNGDRGDVVTAIVTARRNGSVSTSRNSATVFNTPPTTQDASGRGTSGAQIVVPIVGFDADRDALTFKRVGGPRNGVGEFVKAANGQTSFVYRSRADFVGTEEIRFVAVDPTGRTSTPATIIITITVTPSSSAGISSFSGAATPSGGGS